MLLPNTKAVQVKEQIINDLASGLILIFTAIPNGEFRLHVMGDNLPFGNRTFMFDKDGKLVGTGTALACCPRDNIVT